MEKRGAGGMIAAETVARAAPDGYTFLVAAPNTHIFATLLSKNVPFDPVKDFALITKFDVTPNVLIAHPTFPPNTHKRFTPAHPGKVNFASSGAGSGGHLSILLLQDQLNINVLHVPYKGAGPAMLEVLSGRNYLMFINAAVAMSNYKAGKLKVLGFAGPKRLSTLPEVPTFDEQGFVDFESQNFKGLAAPARTPQFVIDKLHEILVKVVNIPDITARLIAGDPFPDDHARAICRAEPAGSGSMGQALEETWHPATIELTNCVQVQGRGIRGSKILLTWWRRI
jgi:tripartite-type tricarboxylate transporter receptor subunit TctC